MYHQVIVGIKAVPISLAHKCNDPMVQINLAFITVTSISENTVAGTCFLYLKQSCFPLCCDRTKVSTLQS